MNFRKIKSVISLLEDESQRVASGAMNELFRYGKKAHFLIKRYQESPNILLRKRIHQFQAITRARKLREILSRRLNNIHSGVWNGLLEIHMLWFDRDLKENINELFWLLFEEFKLNCDLSSANCVASFMKSRGFVVPIKGDIDPELYCIGPVLESKIGTEVLLCSIVYKLLIESGKESKIVKVRDRFGVLYDDRYIIMSDEWKVINSSEAGYRECLPRETLRNVALKLFLSSITSDNFRYTYTIGSCLGKTSKIDAIVKLSSSLKEKK